MKARAAGYFGLFALLYLVPPGLRPLSLPDEFRYAEVAREMVASGDWVVPRLDGFPYLEKPVLGYWLTALSQVLVGHNRFALRLPAALAAGATALVLAWLVRRALGRDHGELAGIAAIVYLTSLLAVVVGSLLVLDGPLTLFLTATLASLFVATEAEPRSREERGWLLAAGAASGLAFLTKGFLAWALPGLIGGLYLLGQRRGRELPRFAVWPVVAAGVVTLPWAALVQVREPDFWRFFFWHEHVDRFLGRLGEQHPEPWWYFLAATPVLLLPWTFLVPALPWRQMAAERGTVRRRLGVFCAIWAGCTYLLFSASGGKLLTYVLPASPALALAMTLAWAPSFADRPTRGQRMGLQVGAGLVGLLAAGIVADRVAGHRVATLFAPAWRADLLAAAFALSALALWLAARRTSLASALRFAALFPLPVLLVMGAALPERFLAAKAPGAFLARIGRSVGPETMVLADYDVGRAACWVFQRSDVYIVGWQGELRYAAERDPGNPRWVELEEVRRTLRRHGGDAILITSADKYDEWKPFLPRPQSEESTGRHGFVVVRFAGRR